MTCWFIPGSGSTNSGDPQYSKMFATCHACGGPAKVSPLLRILRPRHSCVLARHSVSKIQSLSTRYCAISNSKNSRSFDPHRHRLLCCHQVVPHRCADRLRTTGSTIPELNHLFHKGCCTNQWRQGGVRLAQLARQGIGTQSAKLSVEIGKIGKFFNNIGQMAK